jgi:hypothetical protein
MSRIVIITLISHRHKSLDLNYRCTRSLNKLHESSVAFVKEYTYHVHREIKEISMGTVMQCNYRVK